MDGSAQQDDHDSHGASETSELAVSTEWQKQDKQRGWRGEDRKWDTRNSFAQMTASTVMKCPWFLLCQEIDGRPQHQKWQKPRLQPRMPNRQVFCGLTFN